MHAEPNKALVDELIQNNISLEKATLQLVDSVKTMSDKMDRLLTLFEDAARNIDASDIKEPLAQQLTTLLEQNRVLARGLITIENYLKSKGRK